MKLGDQIEPFSTSDQSGQTVTSEALVKDDPVVLFFYPKAFTSGCAAESCHFRDLGSEFAAAGATRREGLQASRAPAAGGRFRSSRRC